jgi:uncharacterized membrane protein YoaK (UPF0700 family)
MTDIATTDLRELHDDYAEQMNLAAAEDRDDIIQALSAQFAAVGVSRQPALPNKAESDSPGKDGVSTQRAQGPLPALLIALTVVTGLVDAFSFLGLGHVFVANMTGNVVFIGLGLAGFGQVVPVLVAVLAFVLGAAAGGRWSRTRPTHRGRLLAVATATQAVVVVSAAVVAASAGVSGSATRLVLLGLLAAAMGGQNAIARRLAVPDLTTTVLTLTVTGLVADDTTARVRRRRIVPVVAMLGGALTGAALLQWVGSSAPLWIAAGVLVSCFIAVHLASRRPQAEAWR